MYQIHTYKALHLRVERPILLTFYREKVIVFRSGKCIYFDYVQTKTKQNKGKPVAANLVSFDRLFCRKKFKVKHGDYANEDLETSFFGNKKNRVLNTKIQLLVREKNQYK